MSRVRKLDHQFVEFIPEKIEAGKLYISMEYATAVHNCCCGCGQEVVTPFSPTDWKLIFNGKNVSLHPSIGNWSFNCRSHYWVKNGSISWAEQWSDQQVSAGRRNDIAAKQSYFSNPTIPVQKPNILTRMVKAIFG